MADKNVEATFTQDGAKRIVDATRWVERQPSYSQGGPKGGAPILSPFWAKIISSTQRQDDEDITINRWWYTIEERILERDGDEPSTAKQTWRTPANPRTSSRAINVKEPLSQASYSVDSEDVWAEEPVPNNEYVLICPQYDSFGNVVYAFERIVYVTYEVPTELSFDCNEDGTFTVTVEATKNLYGPAGQ